MILRPLSIFFILLCFASQSLLAQDSTATLQLLFIGDVMGHGPQVQSAQVVKNERYDYEPCFEYVKPIIESADLAIGNLEVTLPGKPPYRGYPQFRSPDDLAKALRLAGFDMMVTSNNHSNDAGKSGVIKTIETLKNYGFYQTGTFRNPEEREWFYPLVVYKNGFKLAFLNYTYDTNGIPTRSPTVVNLIDTTQMKTDMELARNLQPDAIIVLMHWGLEYQLKESKEQRRIAQQLFEWGADYVIGSHPHVIQPIKDHSLMEGDSLIDHRLCVYSLGNFISNQTKPNTDGGLMFEMTMFKNLSTGQITHGPHHYIPVWRYIEKDKRGKSTYRVLPISAFETENVLAMPTNKWKAMRNFARKMRKHLEQYDSFERRITLEDLQIHHLRNTETEPPLTPVKQTAQ
jgi:poly-gamma-glutamate synthesis protein (capsule biosynthesis protein)